MSCPIIFHKDSNELEFTADTRYFDLNSPYRGLVISDEIYEKIDEYTSIVKTEQ